MKTTATNRKVRELLTQLREGKLEPRPEFQRRLVWSNKDKIAFLDTVLKNYPFPEIYVAAGDVDVDTGVGREMLVDGQQRITTLFEYFSASPTLKLPVDKLPYAHLAKDEKERFLQYDVVVRDLGKVPLGQIKEVFQRINATRYALNAMEIHNARYEGALKTFAEHIAQNDFFARHSVFSVTEIKRMQDTRFVLTLVVTLLSTYFNRDDALEEYLQQYNDDFPHEATLRDEIANVFSFVDGMELPPHSRAWQGADLFSLLVELHRAFFKDRLGTLRTSDVRGLLLAFYDLVDNLYIGVTEPHADVVLMALLESAANYQRAALQATNDRSSRITRGEAIRTLLRRSVER